MGLRFELNTPTVASESNRADVACFIGYVARRAGAPLPAALRAQLAAAGWVHGAWARSPAQLEQLLDLPLTLESWEQFDALFAWESRPVGGDSTLRCATYLGAALRSFFGHGGRRAIVVRVGDPWPLLEDAAQHSALRRTRLRRLLPDFAYADAPDAPFDPGDPGSWRGIEHLYGERSASMVLLPDLADACALNPPAPTPEPLVRAAAEGFAECSVEQPLVSDLALQQLAAPRLDKNGYAAWKLAVDTARRFVHLRLDARETLLVASLPLPQLDAHRIQADGAVYAQADALGWLERMGVLGADSAQESARSDAALVQLAWPWLALQGGARLPAGLEPPEGTLAGLIAASAVERGCHRSVAGAYARQRLHDVVGAEPIPAWGLDDDAPGPRLHQRVCVFAPEPGGWALQSDVTTQASGSCRFGGASRLISNLLRACRVAGQALAFEPNAQRSWAQLRALLEDVLLGYWRCGAFNGETPAQAWQLRCDASTMTRNDLDSGRLIVLLTVWPAMAIERITVALNLGAGQRPWEAA